MSLSQKLDLLGFLNPCPSYGSNRTSTSLSCFSKVFLGSGSFVFQSEFSHFNCANVARLRSVKRFLIESSSFSSTSSSSSHTPSSSSTTNDEAPRSSKRAPSGQLQSSRDVPPESLTEKIGNKNDIIIPELSSLRHIRAHANLLSSQLTKALAEENYIQAGKLRSALSQLSSRDPAFVYWQNGQDLDQSINMGNFSKAKVFQDDVNTAKNDILRLLTGSTTNIWTDNCFVWGGLYGSNGVQHIKIYPDASSRGDKIVAVKLRGDDNVPAGKLSFQADISPKSLILPTPYARLIPGQTSKVRVENTLDGVLKTAFPDRTALYRFKGEGQVANKDFTNSEWVPGELIIFEQGTIAFAWLPIGFMVLFEKVNDF